MLCYYPADYDVRLKHVARIQYIIHTSCVGRKVYLIMYLLILFDMCYVVLFMFFVCVCVCVRARARARALYRGDRSSSRKFGPLHNALTLRLLMSYIYGAPILDVSRLHTTTQHSR